MRRTAVAVLSVLALCGGAVLISTGAPAAAETVPDAPSAGSYDAALLIAQAWSHPVVDLSQESSTSETSINPDGTSTVDSSSEPIRMLEDGSWRPIDMTLHVQADGSIAPTRSPADVSFGGAGSTSLAVLDQDGARVGYDWSQPLPTPKLSGATATYSQVKPGVDLVVSATPVGFETSFVYQSEQAAASAKTITLPLEMDGVAAQRDASGDMTYVDASGTPVATTPAAQAWDSSDGGTAVDPGRAPTVDAPDALVTSSAAESGQAERVSVPADLLASSTTQYPVIVDPAVECTTCSEVDHGYVENDGYDEIDTGWDSGHVHVGTFDGSTVARGLYSFKQPAAVHGQSIASAYLKLTEVDAWNSTDEPVTVYKSAAFDTSSNWSPGVSTTNAQTLSFAYGHDVTHAAPSFNVKGIVSDFVNDAGQTRFYFQLRTNESSTAYWKEFAATATLEITYHSIPVIANNFSVTPCFAKCAQPVATSTASPVVEGQASTADGEQLDYYFDYAASWSDTTPGRTEEVDNVDSGTDMTHRTATALGSGDGDYLYRFRACDAGSTVCATSAWFKFTVDTKGPNAPTASSPTFDTTGATRQGAENQSGQIALRDTSTGATGVYEIAYSFQPGVTTPPPCSSNSGGVVALACGTDLGSSTAVTFNVIPRSLSNTLYVWVYDVAGRSASAAFPINVTSTLASQADHAWTEHDADDVTPAATSVADRGIATTAAPLSLSGNASWLGIDQGPHQDALSFSGQFVNGNAGAATTGAARPLTIDAAHSFTVVAWVRLASIASGDFQTAVAMDGASYSQFYLQERSGVWRFCMPKSQTSSAGTACVASTASAVVGQWAMLVGEWDSANQKLILTVKNPNGDPSWSDVQSASDTTVPAAHDGSITIGRAMAGAAGNVAAWNLFSGAVADPIVYNSMLDTTQIQSLYTGLPSNL